VQQQAFFTGINLLPNYTKNEHYQLSQYNSKA